MPVLFARKTKMLFLYLQELADLRSSDLKSFKDIQVDESNLLVWNGLIVPVSEIFIYKIFKNFFFYFRCWLILNEIKFIRIIIQSIL